MPPAKRAKRSKAAASTHTPPPPVAPVSTSPKDHDETKEETISNASSAPTFDSIEPVDPALIDEEEVPDADENEDVQSTKAVPGKQRSTYGGGYNALKTFNGQVYSGMAIGGSHTWNYDQGVWKETKEEPDLWKIDYKTTKRRARNAPKGSGAPVGTAYHWYIIAHQYVEKVDANTYETHLTGSKYKLAHKNASSNSWSIPTVKGQREREIELLQDAQRRVQGMPPVLAGEKVKVAKEEKGQQKLDSLFAKAGTSKASGKSDDKKRKREQEAEVD
ncbi:hypothetical protein Plec18167_001023 [Paecilomyces lecythidis]|uniref:Uncharacterized protein n=1 Tax=Paecilomyces lecythidis TaxID=3004212 RepID=A0ABR3YDK3_9EURO